jgi:hypothetical protein
MNWRRLRYWDRIDEMVVQKRPLLVFFGLTVFLPPTICFALAGAVTAGVTSVQHPRETAMSLAPLDLQDDYSKALLIVRRECVRTYAARECFKDAPASSEIAVTRMRSVIDKANLKECRREAMDARYAADRDYFSCTGSPAPSGTLKVVWLANGFYFFVAFVGVLFLVGRNRQLLPRFSPHLWFTPYAIVALSSSVLPFFASLFAFYFRTAEDQEYRALGVTGGGLFLAILVCIGSAIWVADLRTHAPDRDFRKGLAVLAGAVPALLVCVALTYGVISGDGNRLGLAVLDLCVIAGTGLALIYASRRPDAQRVSMSTLRFLRRLVVLEVLPLSSLLVFVILISGWSSNGMRDLGMCAGLLVVGFLASRFIEPLMKS